MVSVCTVPARGGRSCERFGGYKTINRIPFTFTMNEMNLRLHISHFGNDINHFIVYQMISSPYFVDHRLY